MVANIININIFFINNKLKFKKVNKYNIKVIYNINT